MSASSSGPNYVAVVLRIDSGSFASGFRTTLQILEEGRQIGNAQPHNLPAAPEVPSLYATWQNAYTQLGQNLYRKIEVVPEQKTHEASIRDCTQAQGQLEQQITTWFETGFDQLRDRIQAQLAQLNIPAHQAIPVIIHSQTGDPAQDILLRKLPWHLWSLYHPDYLRNAEVALMPRFARPVASLKRQVRVLAIFGSSEGGLALTQDLHLLQQITEQHGGIVFAENAIQDLIAQDRSGQLAAHQCIILPIRQPDREILHQLLFNLPWDILFFAGHSFSDPSCQTGYLQIQDGPAGCLALNALRVDLQQAVENGLKLAIFNSCDGLGIADYLATLNVPTTIVMREPVPDRVARRFLSAFLREFFAGRSLCLAVRRAREQLHWMESDQLPCPAASWLPIVVKNPNQPDLAWTPEPSAPLPLPPDRPRPFKQRILRIMSQTKESPITLLIALLLTLGLLGGLAYWIYPKLVPVVNITGASSDAKQTDRGSWGEKQLIHDATTPAKEAGIAAFQAEDYAKAVDWFEASLKLNANDPETRIYLNNARLRLQNRRTYVIATSVPIGNKSNIAQEILRGVAQAQDEINQQGGINGTGLEVKIIDDRNDSEIAKQVAEDLVQDQAILAVVGHNTSRVALPAAEIYQKHGLVMISPTTFDPNVSKVGNYIFRAVPTPEAMAEPLADYILKQLPQSPKMLVCGDPRIPDQNEFRDALLDKLRRDGGNLVDIRCDYSAKDFNPELIINQGMAQGANGLFAGTNVDDFGPTLNLIQANNRRLPLFGSATFYTQEVIQKGQAAIEGLVTVTPWSPEAYPGFARQAQKVWGATVNWRTAMAYDATRAVIAGLQQNPTRSGLQQTMQDLNFSTSGSINEVKFLGTRDRLLKPILVQVQPDGAGGYRFIYLK